MNRRYVSVFAFGDLGVFGGKDGGNLLGFLRVLDGGVRDTTFCFTTGFFN